MPGGFFPIIGALVVLGTQRRTDCVSTCLSNTVNPETGREIQPCERCDALFDTGNVDQFSILHFLHDYSGSSGNVRHRHARTDVVQFHSATPNCCGYWPRSDLYGSTPKGAATSRVFRRFKSA